ncbi:exodeoxyribonuclease V subunit alpha [Buchnera aphidicola]|uniref:RecBCD enzyme subunit RecD n=1 Tax=Buchnera aphidicola subsp. Melaphis rhois TaxID=118103 RepID=A0A4D6YCP4_BUCMH|nr:exodeoxyribonuclease V subunit alpha [Buchnera aphidicola]QCI23420.1 exodeoxyribonuclease V subunit alpha [Buchnera aphidicola (Melaphis rhois)]
MKIIYLLKQAIQKNIITPLDLYFSIAIHEKNNVSSQTLLLSVCVHYFIRIGHTCLPITTLKNQKVFNTTKNKILINAIWKEAKLLKKLRLATLNNKIISNGFYPTPLVFYKEKIYFHKTWIAEKKVFNFISQSNNYNTTKLHHNKKKIMSLLHQKTENLQKIAIILSIINKITFIIGGPGTGKTTIVAKILIAITIMSNKKLNIQLTAPTGKAANNLTESVRKSISQLSPLYKKNISISSAITLHRLLKISSEYNSYSEKIHHSLNIDVLIIDESSMIDLFTMEKLIDNIPKTTKIIFLGDHYQLPSINCGHILKDIFSYYQEGYSECIIKKINLFNVFDINKVKNYKFSNINNKICILKKNYRFKTQSNIAKISTEIQKNKLNNLKKLFQNIYKDIKFFPLNTVKDYEEMILNLTLNYTDYWNSLKQNANPKDIISIFNNCRLMCILKNSCFGVKRLNLELENEMKRRGLIKYITVNKKNVYFGQPILILKNDYSIKLYNGDIGIIMYDDKKVLKACFYIQNKNKIKFIPINLLPKFQTSWAITVHKSQGSEFLHAILVLPNIYSCVLTKELIYTAVTRAKQKLTIYSSKKIFIKSIKNETKRYSGLSINERIY